MELGEFRAQVLAGYEPSSERLTADDQIVHTDMARLATDRFPTLTVCDENRPKSVRNRSLGDAMRCDAMRCDAMRCDAMR